MASLSSARGGATDDGRSPFRSPMEAPAKNSLIWNANISAYHFAQPPAIIPVRRARAENSSSQAAENRETEVKLNWPVRRTNLTS